MTHFDLTGNPDVPSSVIEPTIWDTPGWNPHRIELKEDRLRTKFSRDFLSDMSGLRQSYVSDMRSEFRNKASRTQKSVAGTLKFGYSILIPSLPETVSILKNICDVAVIGDMDHEEQVRRRIDRHVSIVLGYIMYCSSIVYCIGVLIQWNLCITVTV